MAPAPSQIGRWWRPRKLRARVFSGIAGGASPPAEPLDCSLSDPLRPLEAGTIADRPERLYNVTRRIIRPVRRRRRNALAARILQRY